MLFFRAKNHIHRELHLFLTHAKAEQFFFRALWLDEARRQTLDPRFVGDVSAKDHLAKENHSVSRSRRSYNNLIEKVHLWKETDSPKMPSSSASIRRRRRYREILFALDRRWRAALTRPRPHQHPRPPRRVRLPLPVLRSLLLASLWKLEQVMLTPLCMVCLYREMPL